MEKHHQPDFSPVQETLFEENYLRRTHKTLTTSPVVALTELVANAWDAGATEVEISIPSAAGSEISIQDNGTGLTIQEFKDRWLKLGYDRISHQGRKVEFPCDVASKNARMAFGRNGVGRHGMLCFNEQYQVLSRKNGFEFEATIDSIPECPIRMVNSKTKPIDKNFHGTKISTIADEHLPNADEILKELSARFVTDPNFQIIVNGSVLPLSQLQGLVKTTEINVGEISLKVHFIDAEKALRKAVYQGIAFWQNHRLVGEPSWTLGNDMVLDGRTSEAKRFVFVVESDDLGQFVKEDWTGFERKPEMAGIFTAVKEVVLRDIKDAISANVAVVQKDVKEKYRREYSALSGLAKLQVEEAFRQVEDRHPIGGAEPYEIAIETVIKLARERSGQELLSKIANLDQQDVETLNKILDKWSLKDALVVLEEIDRRLSAIEAIKRFSERNSTDEVAVLEPLITESRWIFGPEFDSVEYCANNQLRTIAKKIYELSDADFANPRKRPDLFVKGNNLYSMVGISEIDSTGISQLQKILIVEIKRGGFTITRKERDQAVHYVEDFLSSGLIESAKIVSFVVGHAIDAKTATESEVQNNRGSIRIVTYSQLVDTANARLFNLKQTIQNRYDQMSDSVISPSDAQMKLPGL